MPSIQVITSQASNIYIAVVLGQLYFCICFKLKLYVSPSGLIEWYFIEYICVGWSMCDHVSGDVFVAHGSVQRWRMCEILCRSRVAPRGEALPRSSNAWVPLARSWRWVSLLLVFRHLVCFQSPPESSKERIQRERRRRWDLRREKTSYWREQCGGLWTWLRGD